MKKTIAAILLIVVLVTSVGLLAACGPNGGSNNTLPSEPNFDVPEGGYDGSSVDIVFYHTMGADKQALLDNYYIPAFNALYPNIHVTHKAQGDYDGLKDILVTEIAAKTQPNIAFCYADHVAQYNRAKVVTTLDNLINSDIEITRADGSTETLGLTQEQIDNFVPGYYEEGRSFGNDLMYTLPFAKSTEVMFYNKSVFEAQGWQVPTTWDELEALLPVIKAYDPDGIPLGYDSEANWFITMCEQLGSDYTEKNGQLGYFFDNAQNREFVTRFRRWYKNGWVTTKAVSGGAYTSDLFKKGDDEVGKLYMCIGSSAGAKYQKPLSDPEGTSAYHTEDGFAFEAGICAIPQIDPANPKVISQGPSVCIFQKSNPQEVIASWLFVKFLTTSEEFQIEYSMDSGYVPSIQSVNSNPVYANFLATANGTSNIMALSAKQCAEQVNAYYSSPAFRGSSTARTEVGILLQNAFVWEGSDAEAIANAFDEAMENCLAFGS